MSINLKEAFEGLTEDDIKSMAETYVSRVRAIRDFTEESTKVMVKNLLDIVDHKDTVVEGDYYKLIVMGEDVTVIDKNLQELLINYSKEGKWSTSMYEDLNRMLYDGEEDCIYEDIKGALV